MKLGKFLESEYCYGFNIKKIIGKGIRKVLYVAALVSMFLLGIGFERLKDGKLHIEQSIISGEKVSGSVSIEEIEAEIRNVGELSTVEYFYTDAGKFTDVQHIIDFEIPLTTKSFIVRWNGTIKAGVDLSKIKTEINEKAKMININIPKAQVLSHEINENSFETLDETKNIFNPISVDDVKTFIGDNKGFMEEKAIKGGLLDEAIDNVENVIMEQLRNIKNKYSISFEVSQ